MTGGGLVDPDSGQPINEAQLEALGWTDVDGEIVLESAEPFSPDPTDVRVIVPRVRRAIEGAGAPPVLTDAAVKDVVADAIADVILYTGGVFGKHLLVTATDPDTGAPAEYATSKGLSLPEQSVIAAQAALNYFFQRFALLRTSERISNEGSTWEWTLSPALLTSQLTLLKQLRDEAIAKLSEGQALEQYVSFVHVRDRLTSNFVEPWVRTGGSLMSGQEVDVRFGVWG